MKSEKTLIYRVYTELLKRWFTKNIKNKVTLKRKSQGLERWFSG